MNIDWLATRCPMKKKMMSLINACNISQMISRPTRVVTNRLGHTSKTCIDHIYTNAPERCSNPISLPVGYSDHNLIAITTKTKIPKCKVKITHKRLYKKFIPDRFVEEVQNAIWSEVYATSDPEASLSIFMNILMGIVDKHAPLRKCTSKSKPAPWLNESLRDLMKKRDIAKKTLVKSGSVEDRLKYCQLRNQVTKMNQIMKKEYYKSRINNVKQDGRELWKTLNEIMGRKATGGVSFVESEGRFLTNPPDIANYFNDFFTDKVATLRQGMSKTDIDTCDLIKNNIMQAKSCTLSFKCVKESLVRKLLKALPDHGSAGTDTLDSKVLSLAADYISGPVCHILNKCLEQGVYPSTWKEAKIIPLPKDSKSPLSGKNSRPIAILPVLSKLMERIIHSQIQEYFESNGLATGSQHAYRHNYSTCTALTQMTDDWLKGINNFKMTGAVLLDFSAAFDVIDHDLLIDKLKCYGFEPNSISFMRSYLSDRTQKVYYNGSWSNSRGLDCGVPQGSCLGPLLYSIFTNDLPFVLVNALIQMYADDSTLYFMATSCAELNKVLSYELGLVVDWIKRNRLVLNISKTKSIILGSFHKLSSKPTLKLKIAKVPIEQLNTVKLLGVLIDNSLTWSEHVDSIVKKMGSGIAMVRKCLPYVPAHILGQVVKSLVLSYLDYCSPVWSSASKTVLDKLQVAQNRAARLVLHCPIRTNIDSMHSKLSWLKVDKRLALSTVTLLGNSVYTAKPEFLHSQVIRCSVVHNHFTRAADDGQVTLPQSNRNSRAFRKTVVYRAINLWNACPHNIRQSNSKFSFKYHLRKYYLNN